MELFEWQKPMAAQAVKELTDGRTFVLGACTGAGKTPISCEVIKRIGRPALVVTPKVNITQFSRTVEAMGVKDLVIDVINPEKISTPKGCKYYTRADGWKNVPEGSLLVFDEIHRGASGKDSVTTKAIAQFGSKLHPDNKLMALSATLADSPLKMRAIGYWMGFHRFTDVSFYDWCRRYGCSTQRIGRFPHVRSIFAFTTNRVKAADVMATIRRDMGTRFLSVTPEDIPGFPDEVKEVTLVDLDDKDHEALVKAYDEMPKQYLQKSEDDMVKTLRLRQQAEFCKAKAIAEMAEGLVEDGVSVFIALNFTGARKRIEEYLESKKVPFASIYGGQDEKERQSGIDAFQRNEIHVMVGMMAACSVAVSLHDDRHERRRVSLISPGYSAPELVQSLGRIRRVGGTAAVQRIIIAAGTVEERVGRTIERKLGNLSALNDGDLAR